MTPQQPPPGITAHDWAAPPSAVQSLVRALVAVVATGEPLKPRVAELEARLNQPSRPSSPPPASAPPRAPPRPAKEPAGRKSGGQPGHQGPGRGRKPVEDVDRISAVRPECCGQGGTLRLGEEPTPERHQVSDLPRVAPLVTEYRRPRLGGGAWGATTPAAWPVTLPSGRFGPGLQATVGYLTGRVGMSQREGHEVWAAVCQTAVSGGSIAALAQAVRTALAVPVVAAAPYGQRQPVRTAAETGWREQGKRGWVWIRPTARVTVVRGLAPRGAARAKARLGEDFWGVVGTDR